MQWICAVILTAAVVQDGKQAPYQTVSPVSLCNQEEVVFNIAPMTKAMAGIKTAPENGFGLGSDSLEINIVHNRIVITPPCHCKRYHGVAGCYAGHECPVLGEVGRTARHRDF